MRILRERSTSVHFSRADLQPAQLQRQHANFSHWVRGARAKTVDDMVLAVLNKPSTIHCARSSATILSSAIGSVGRFQKAVPSIAVRKYWVLVFVSQNTPEWMILPGPYPLFRTSCGCASIRNRLVAPPSARQWGDERIAATRIGTPLLWDPAPFPQRGFMQSLEMLGIPTCLGVMPLPVRYRIQNTGRNVLLCW